jgi:hypothetical protein
MQWFQQVTGRQGGIWIRQVEHGVLRVVSLAFSLGSAHAIRWFFSPLDQVDQFEPVITWVVAIGFGVLGYFVSRGLAHRIMNREQIWAYVPICLVVEFVEMFCNYALAAAVIANATWLHSVPEAQRSVLTFMTYVALSIIPLVSLLLAVVDVDLDRSKQVGGRMSPKVQPRWGNGQPQTVGSYPSGYAGQTGYTNASGKPRAGESNNSVPLGVMPVP